MELFVKRFMTEASADRQLLLAMLEDRKQLVEFFEGKANADSLRQVFHCLGDCVNFDKLYHPENGAQHKASVLYYSFFAQILKEVYLVRVRPGLVGSDHSKETEDLLLHHFKTCAREQIFNDVLEEHIPRPEARLVHSQQERSSASARLSELADGSFRRYARYRPPDRLPLGVRLRLREKTID